MAAFSAKDVASLREKTGCGMMDCKKALSESNGDMEAATNFLREKGLSAAAKKAGRIAAEGIVLAEVENNIGAVVEVNTETDFVAKNKDFQTFVNNVAKTVIKSNPADVDALLKTNIENGNETVQAALQEKILVIGENIKIRRFVRYEGVVSTYVHAGGVIGVMVKFDTDCAGDDKFNVFAKDIAMQIAAANPKYLNKNDVPADVVEKEKEILTAQAINEGKPANIAEKMVMGRIGKYYKDICLLEQSFVKNGDITIAQYIKDTAKELGGKIDILEFTRFEKGEGLEKREDNFADEVAGMIK